MKQTVALLRTVSAAHSRREKAQLFFTVCGVALGIAVFAAIRTANLRALEAMEHSAQLLKGRSPLSVSSAGGRVLESEIPTLRRLPGVSAVAPRSARHVPARARRAEAEPEGASPLGLVHVVGLDLLANRRFGYWPVEGADEGFDLRLFRPPPAAFISGALDEQLDGRALELLVEGKYRPVSVFGVLPEDAAAKAVSAKILVLDIARYQALFGEYGVVDQLDLLPDPAVDEEALRRTLGEELPPQLALSEPGELARYARKTTEAFRLNLSFLAAISLCVSVLLIYNASSYAILRRRSELATLLTLGASRKTLFLMLLTESALAGVVGALGGAVIGALAASETAAGVGATISALYLPLEPGQRGGISISILLECLVLGPAAAIAGGIAPAAEIFKIPLREGFSYQTYEETFAKRVGSYGRLGALLLLAVPLASTRAVLASAPVAPFAAPLLLLSGFLLLVPSVVLRLLRGARRVFGAWSVAGLLAADHLERTLRRTSICIAAVSLALSLYLGVSIMIASFRTSVEHWISTITTADFYLSSGETGTTRENTALPPELPRFLGIHPLVDTYDTLHSRRIRYGERMIKVLGVPTGTRARMQWIVKPEPVALSREQPERTAIVSEPFATHFAVTPGDTISLPGASGTVPFVVAGIYRDYSYDQGVVRISREHWRALFGDSPPEGISVYLTDRLAAGRFRADLEAAFRGTVMTVRNQSELRAEVLRVFDATFRITYVLQLVAGVVSALAVLSTISMLLFERRRELSVLGALGAGRTVLRTMVAIEAAILGGLGTSVSLLLGPLLAALLVLVLNRFFFGWTMIFVSSPMLLVGTAIAATAAAIAAGSLAARRSISQVDPGALRYE